MQHVSSPSNPWSGRALERSLPLCMCLCLAGCSADMLSNMAPNSQSDDLAVVADPSDDSGMRAPDSGVVTRGAGMPIVPIHRADAGATHDAQTGSADASLDGAQPVRALDPDAGEARPLMAEPIHRYSFSGGGSSVADDQGGRAAVIRGNAVLDGHGAVTFPGAGDGVVELPDDVLDTVTSFTVLIWLQVHSEACGQRALDISLMQPGPPGAGSNGSPGPAPGSLYLTPYGCPAELPTLGYVDASTRFLLTSQTTVRQSELVQLGVSYSTRSRTLRLIVDGEVQNEQTVALETGFLPRARALVGRSQLDSEPQLHGAITELRIYASKLEDDELEALFERGPDTL